MTSEKARMVVRMLRTAKSQGFETGKSVDYAKRRAIVEERHAQQPRAEGIDFRELSAEGIEMVCCEPRQITSDHIVLYIHGGGFMTGSAKSSMAYASWLAASSGMLVYTVSYRLAPEYPYPAAPEDCFVAYKALLSRHPGQKISLVGGSAGGNLCLAVTLSAREQGIAMPATLGLFSPVGCCAPLLPSHDFNSDRDCMLSKQTLDEIRSVYCRDADVRDPHLSPVFADLTGFPPMYLVADQDEVLLDDILLLVEHARIASVHAQLKVTSGLFHDFPSAGSALPESVEIMDELVAFMNRGSV